MYKVGIMIMGRAGSNSTTVKEIVLEVQAKTKIRNLFDYLLELEKITHTHVYIALERKGRPISEESTVSQLMRHVKPTNGVIKLFLYEQTEEESQQKLELKRSRHQPTSSSSIINPEKPKNSIRESKTSQEASQKRCCCF